MTTAIVNALTALPHAEFLKVMARPPRGVTLADLNEAKVLRVDRLLKAKRSDHVSKRIADDDGLEDFRQEGVVAKVNRSATLGAVIAQATDDLVRKTGMSRADAATAITNHPSIQEMVRLEREVMLAQQERRDAADLSAGLMVGKAAGPDRSAAYKLDALVKEHMDRHGVSANDAYDKVLASKEGRKLLDDDRRSRGILVNTGSDEDDVDKANNTLPRDTARRAHNPPGDENVAESANDVLNRIADAQMKAQPGLTRAQAINRAADTREFGEAHRAEQLRKFAHV